MKAAISIPDDVFEDAERLARRLLHSRSQLYTRALREFVARHERDQVTAALDEVWEGEPALDAFVARAGRRVIERTEG
jgi:predicted transcriptional regulator